MAAESSVLEIVAELSAFAFVRVAALCNLASTSF